MSASSDLEMVWTQKCYENMKITCLYQNVLCKSWNDSDKYGNKSPCCPFVEFLSKEEDLWHHGYTELLVWCLTGWSMRGQVLRRPGTHSHASVCLPLAHKVATGRPRARVNRQNPQRDNRKMLVLYCLICFRQNRFLNGYHASVCHIQIKWCRMQ